MKNNWLWDRKTTEAGAKKILTDPANKDFISMAGLLLARKNDPREVFKQYLDPRLFCERWPSIKRKMRQDKWTEPRIVFWQAIYENLAQKYRRQGVLFRKEALARDPLCTEVGKKISDIRREQGLSQKEFAAKMGVSQQLISRIEKGRENISLVTFAAIAAAMNRNVRIELSKK